MTHLLPRQPVPELSVPTLRGNGWTVASAKPQRFSLIVFYRGLHCPICRKPASRLDPADRGEHCTVCSTPESLEQCNWVAE